MKTVVITRSFAGSLGSFSASEDPVEVSDEVASMAIAAGFAVEVKPAKAAKKRPAKKAKKANE